MSGLDYIFNKNELTNELTSIIIRNKETDNMCDISLANSIRRALYTTSGCYSFNYEMTKAQKNIYNNYFNTKFPEDEVVFSVSYDNYYNKQTFAHRLTLIPLYYSDETRYIFEEGLYVLLTDAVDFSKPYINKNSEPKYIYTNDLRFMRLNKSTDTMEDITPEEKKMLIKFNIPFVILLKDNGIHMIGNPQYNIGYVGGHYEPVCIQYNFGQNSTPTYERRDNFDNPKNIEIIVEFNGMKELKLAVNDSYKFLILQLESIKTHYNLAQSNSSDIIKIENNEIGVQNIKINSTDELYLADHTMGNLLESHLIYTLYDLLFEYKHDFDELYRYTLISYVSPDLSLINRFITIKYQIPPAQGFLDFVGTKLNCATDLISVKQRIFISVCNNLIAYYNKIMIV